MKTLTAIICPGKTKRWLIAYNPETGTATQGKSVEEVLKNLKEATALFLEEMDQPIKIKFHVTLLEHLNLYRRSELL